MQICGNKLKIVVASVRKTKKHLKLFPSNKEATRREGERERERERESERENSKSAFCFFLFPIASDLLLFFAIKICVFRSSSRVSNPSSLL